MCTGTFNDDFGFNVGITVRQMILLNWYLFKAFYHLTFVTEEMCMLVHVSHMIVKSIFYQVVIHHDLMEDFLLFKDPKRTVKCCTVIIAS